VIWTDPVTGRKGYAVIDRMVNGLAGGGTRMRPGVSLEEVERLARTMSYKNGAFNLPGGGAKGGLDIDRMTQKREVLSLRAPCSRCTERVGHGRGPRRHAGRYLATADVAPDPTVQAMLDRSGDSKAAGRRVSQGLAIQVEGIGLADCIGGYGVAQAAAACVDHKGWKMSEMRAVVQGFGSMGGSSARYLAKLGARVVGVVDVNVAITTRRVSTSNTCSSRAALWGRSTARRCDPATAKALARGGSTIDTDIIVPRGRRRHHGRQRCQVKARLVVEAANIPTDRRAPLFERGVVVIPDYVANGGANAWWWWTLLGVIEATPTRLSSTSQGDARDRHRHARTERGWHFRARPPTSSRCRTSTTGREAR
jgi:glutamate dehydrogenase (NAD(P)+)